MNNFRKKSWTKPPHGGTLIATKPTAYHGGGFYPLHEGRLYMNLNTYDSQLQVSVSPEGEVMTLQDDRFPWAERKVKTVRLAKLYQKAGYPEYSQKAATCSTWLQIGRAHV